MKISLYLIIIILFFAAGGCVVKNDHTSKPLHTVGRVDLERYTGKWYEIARYEHRFQKGCVGSTATYTLRNDGKIDVVNQCYENSFAGKLRSARGKAWVVDQETNARLKVSFFWPFSGDYWIIDLGENYEYAVVGHPDRKYLWVLSRMPQMDENIYAKILARLETQGYDTSKLLKSKQPQE